MKDGLPINPQTVTFLHVYESSVHTVGITEMSDGRTLVEMWDRANGGGNLTNTGDRVATGLARKYWLYPQNTVWIEHDRYGDATCLMHYSWYYTTIEDMPSHEAARAGYAPALTTSRGFSGTNSVLVVQGREHQWQHIGRFAMTTQEIIKLLCPPQLKAGIKFS